MKRQWILTGMVAIALLARLSAMVYDGAGRIPGGEDVGIALNLIDHQGFSFASFSYHGPTSIRGPAYPMLLAGVYSVFGSERAGTIAALAINVVSAGVSVVLAYWLGRQLFTAPAAAWGMAVFFAIWPTQVQAAVYQQSLSLGIMLLLATLVATLPRNGPIVPLAGLLAGSAALTEPILTVPLIFVIAFIAARAPGRALAMLLAAFCLVTPWMYRNAVVHQRLSGITNNLWPDVFRGNGPGATGSHHLKVKDIDGKPLTRLDRLSPIERDQLKKRPEPARNDLYRKWSLEWITKNPLAYARLCVIRIGKLLWLDWDHPLAFNEVNLIARSLVYAGFMVALLLPRPAPAPSPGVPGEGWGEGSSSALLGKLTDPLPSPPPGYRGRGHPWSLALVAGLMLATAFTLAEARNAVFMDVGQLLAVASLADRKRER